jgi:hypothetical protein
MDNGRKISRWLLGQLPVVRDAAVINSVIFIALSHGEML